MANNKRIILIVNLLIFLLNVLLIAYNIKSSLLFKFPFDEHCGTPKDGVALINGKIYKTDVYEADIIAEVKGSKIILRQVDLKQNGKVCKNNIYRDDKARKVKGRKIVLSKKDLKQNRLEVIVPNHILYRWDLPESDSRNILFLGLSNHYLSESVVCEGATTNKLTKFMFEVNDVGSIILHKWHLITGPDDMELDTVIKIEIT